MSTEVAIPSWEELFQRLPLNKRRDTPPTKEVIFYRDKEAKCPDCQRVWLLMLEKGITFSEEVDEVPQSHVLPAVSINGTTVSGWTAIAHQLEETFPEVRLLPIGDELRAAAEDVASRADSVISLSSFLLADRSSPATAQQQKLKLMEEVQGVESLLAQRSGDFALGDALTVADVALVPVLEAAAVQARAVDESVRLRDNGELPNIDRWFGAMEQRVAGYACRVQADPIALAVQMADYPGLEMTALEAAERLLAEENWREVLGEKVPAAWVSFTRRYMAVAKSPKVEAAAELIRRRAELTDEAAREVSPYNQGQPRARSDVDRGSESVPDLGLRLLACALLEAPDYAAAPTFANTFIRTLLQGLSVDELKEISDISQFMRMTITAPKDLGRLPARVLRAHATWVGREALRAAKENERR